MWQLIRTAGPATARIMLQSRLACAHYERMKKLFVYVDGIKEEGFLLGYSRACLLLNQN